MPAKRKRHPRRHPISHRRRGREGVPAVGSAEALRHTASVARLRSPEEIDSYYRAHPELAATQVEWFHCVYAAAKANCVTDVKRHCQDAWMTSWKFALTDARYHYLAFHPRHRLRRLETLRALIEEQSLNPGMTLLALLSASFRMAQDVIQATVLDGHDRLRDITGATSVHVRDQAGAWRDVVVEHSRVPPAATAAFKLMECVLDTRIRLEALDRGYTIGPGDAFIAPQGASATRPAQELSLRGSAGVPASRIPKATPFASPPSANVPPPEAITGRT